MGAFPHEAAAYSFALKPLSQSLLLATSPESCSEIFKITKVGHLGKHACHSHVFHETRGKVVLPICTTFDSSDQRQEILSGCWRKFCATAKLIGRARELLFDEVPAKRQLEAGWLYLGDGTTHI